MKFNEASNSLKPFKRKYHAQDAWLCTKSPGFTYVRDKPDDIIAFWYDKNAAYRKGRDAFYMLSKADLVADDWEIKEN
jgi:hypothetical protein